MIWIRPAAPGLRAAPSTADAAMRDWPSAPSPAASAKPKPAASALYLLTLSALSAAPFCANVVTADSMKHITPKYSILSFLMLIPPQKGMRQGILGILN